jgi:threonine dehydrogenase-like Zn-dependent dehydrogenase
MRGVWLEDRRLALRRDLPTPRVGEHEALVEVLVAGICSTDLEMVRGYYPFTGVLGHEFVGRVRAGPDGLSGQRVVGEINAVCHACAACRAGRERHCHDRTVLGIKGRDGAFADLLTLPVENLHPVPDAITDEGAVFVEPLAAAFEILEQVEIGASDRVLVVGDGKLGQLVARALASTGCQLRVVGRHPSKLELLAALGIETGSAADVEPKAFDVAIECTGNPSGFEIARRALRPLGTLVLKSTYAGELTLDASAVVVDELTLVGSRCGPFAPALELLGSGAVEVEPLIAARYPLDRALEAFEHAGRRGVLKVLLDMRS